MNQKLIIEAYKSIEYKGGEKLGSITVQINPDSYKLSKSTSYKKDESIKEDKQLPEYKHTNPSTLSFDIHFDGTGIIPTGKKTVTERIKDLENIIFLPSAEIDPPSPCFNLGESHFQGEINQPKLGLHLILAQGQSFTS